MIRQHFSSRLFRNKESGYTLLELLTTILIIATLMGFGIVEYKRYIETAETTALVQNWENMNTSLTAYSVSGLKKSSITCEQVKKLISDDFMKMNFVDLSLGFKQKPNSAQPVLNICASDKSKHNFITAKMAFDHFNNNHEVIGKSVITSSLIAYSVPFTVINNCQGKLPKSTNSCLPSVIQSPTTSTVPAHIVTPQTTTNAPAQVKTPLVTTSSQQSACSQGQESISIASPVFQSINICVAPCPDGTHRDANDWTQCHADATQPATQNIQLPQQTLSPASSSTAGSQSSNDQCKATEELVTMHHGHQYYQVCLPRCPSGTHRRGNSGNCH